MSIIKKENTFAPIVITPPASLELPDFRELWEYRGLLFFLIWRDLKLRFQQTVIGFLWILLQPLILMLIFYVVLGILVKVPTGDIPNCKQQFIQFGGKYWGDNKIIFPKAGTASFYNIQWTG